MSSDDIIDLDYDGKYETMLIRDFFDFDKFSSLKLGWNLEIPEETPGHHQVVYYVKNIPENTNGKNWGVMVSTWDKENGPIWKRLIEVFEDRNTAKEMAKRLTKDSSNAVYFDFDAEHMYNITHKTSSLKLATPASDPSDAQIEAGNYKKDHLRKDGFDITIENKKGSTRSGTDKDGKKWSVKMKHDYGYIKGTEGSDGDHVDVILADDYKEGQSVFIVNQTDDKGKFDEHKCCIGFIGKDDAEKAYLDNYEKGWDNYKSIIEMPMDQFKEWVRDKKYTKNIAKPLTLNWANVGPQKRLVDSSLRTRSAALCWPK